MRRLADQVGTAANFFDFLARGDRGIAEFMARRVSSRWKCEILNSPARINHP